MEHRLPLPVTQYPISCEGRNYRVDFAWPEARLILEFDGEQKYVDHPRQGPLRSRPRPCPSPRRVENRASNLG